MRIVWVLPFLVMLGWSCQNYPDISSANLEQSLEGPATFLVYKVVADSVQIVRPDSIIDFGEVRRGGASDKTIVLSNTWSREISLHASLNGDSVFFFNAAGTSRADTLTIGLEKPVMRRIFFRPTADGDTSNGSLSLFVPGGNADSLKINLKGKSFPASGL
jgi:hypothetical protein